MKIGRIQNQITNSNLVRNVKKVVKPAVLTAAVALGGLAAGGCTSNKEYREPRFYCKGCDYVVYPGTDLNVAHETLYKQFDLAKHEIEKDNIMESAALLEMADENCDEIISSQELRNLEGWDLNYTKEYVVHDKWCSNPAMFLDYYTLEEKKAEECPGLRIFMSPNDLEKCKIDRNNFTFNNMFKMTKHGGADITIKGSDSKYEFEISGLVHVPKDEENHIVINGNGVNYLKISNSKITSITIANRTKDLNIDLIDVKGGKFSPVSVYKDNTKSHININAVNSKYEFSSID